MSTIATVETREQVLLGILFTMGAYLGFSVQDASIKYLVAGIAVWQVLFFRSIAILCGCAVIGGRKLFVDSARSPIFGAMLQRSFLILAAWLCYYTAARSLQLAELTTIYFAAPLIITVLSILMLGEKVPGLRWAAVVIGFVGVFIACDPANLGISVPVLLVLAAAFLWGLAMVLLRKMALKERTMVQLVLNNAFFLVIAGVPMLFWWTTPSLFECLLLIGTGALGGCAQFMIFEGMKRAPVSVVAPFEYTSLIWAFALGFAIWGDVPRAEVFMGAAVIVGAALLIVVDERFRKRD